MNSKLLGRIALRAILVAGLSGCAASHPVSSPANLPVDSGWKLQDSAKVSDSGAKLSVPSYTPAADWHDATVPGTVLTSLVNDGVYPEPLFGENNSTKIIPESLSRTSYWYRTQLTIPREFAGRRVWLNLDGINYIAEVWVNGKEAGEIKGAFARGKFDVTDLVHSGDSAAVAIQILPPPHPGSHPDKSATAGTGRNGGELAEDGPTFLCSIGWDWIPVIRDRDIGIWQRVWLSTSGPVTVEDPHVESDLPTANLDRADLTVSATLRNSSDRVVQGILHGEIFEGGPSFSVPINLRPHEVADVKSSPALLPQLRLANPRLWWPNGYGSPNLYRLYLRCEIDGKISDERNVQFGIRKVTYSVPGSDNLTICVNNVQIMCRGGAWGMDEAMKRIPRERLEAEIKMHQLANLNMIRNWVGQSTSEDFYDLCDRYGIMVWDEFFQPNMSDGPDPADVDLYLANVREKVLRFRNHPCIVIWCGRNESDPRPPAVDEGMEKIMASLDPTRLYHRNSGDGHGVRSGGPYSWQTPQAYFAPRNGEAFKTELGSVSVPTIESIHAMMPMEDWDTINDDWALHDLTRGAQEGRGRTPMYADMLARRYGPIQNLPDFVRKAQLANYEAFRAMYEGREAKMFHPYTGILTWMSNPAQPSFVWQLYSHDLEPNASLFAVKKACEPVHIQMNADDSHVMVINQTAKALSGVAIVKIANLDGTFTAFDPIPVTAPPSAATDLGAIAFPANVSTVHFVKLELRNSTGELISDNFYWRNAEHPDDFTALESLPTAMLQVGELSGIAANSSAGESDFVRMVVTNTSSVVALMAHFQLRGLNGQRILPAYYSDNYVSLLPGESKTIYAWGAAKGGAKIAIDGWNIALAPQSFEPYSDLIELNPDAQLDSEPRGIFSTTTPSTMP